MDVVDNKILEALMDGRGGGVTMTKPECKLVGTDGNVFAIMATVSKCLTEVGQGDRAEEFRKRAMGAKSYDEVLQLLFEYVEPY